MANLNIGQAAALSPVTNFNLTDSLMKGAQFGMQQQAAEARALAARLKKEKIMSLDMSGIHPTLRKEAEDIVYNTTALQKIAADSGQSPMVPFTYGQFQLRGVQARSQRRIDLEKSDPNKYLMDQDAMTAFSKGDASEAKKILEKKGYDPELISALDPENVSFLPEKINIAEQLKKDYDYNTKGGLYGVPKGEPVDIGKGQFYQYITLKPEVAKQAALSIATNQNARLTIMKERPEEYQKELTKELAKTPNEPALAKVRAVQNIIENPNNPFLPSEPIEVTPAKGATFNINMGGNEPKYDPGFLGPTQLAVKGEMTLGSYTGKKEFTIDSEAYILDPQNIGIPKASLRNFDGTSAKSQAGVLKVESANATSIPINTSNTTIHIDTFIKTENGSRQLKMDIKPNQIIDPMLIKNGFVNNYKDKIKFVPAALYTGTSKDASGTQVTKSYYSPLFRGASNIYSDNDMKKGMLEKTLSHLQGFSDKMNKEYGLGGSPKPKETPAERAARIANGG